MIEAGGAAVAGDGTAVLSEALAGAPAISDKSERPGLHELSLDVIAEQMKEGKKRPFSRTITFPPARLR